MRLAAYIRVSGIGQRDNTSPGFQKERIQNYCRSFDHQIVEVFNETASASGHVPRVELEKALSSIHNNEADGLIVFAVDRFARSLLEGLTIVKDLKDKKKDLVIVDLNLDTSTAIGECIFAVLLSFAELERKMILKRTKDGMNQVKQRNGYYGGHPPYGWKTAEVAGVRALIPVDDEQKILVKICSLRESGCTYRVIASELNAAGIVAKRGGRWSQASLCDLFTRNNVLRDWACAKNSGAKLI